MTYDPNNPDDIRDEQLFEKMEEKEIKTHTEHLAEYRQYVESCLKQDFDLSKLLNYEEYLIEYTKLENVMREAIQ